MQVIVTRTSSHMKVNRRELSSESVQEHYNKSQQGKLLSSILNALEKSGVDKNNLHASELYGVDSFHIGGQMATKFFIEKLPLAPHVRVLDIGCGIGGLARSILQASPNAHVHGIDITPEFIETAHQLTDMIVDVDIPKSNNLTFSIGNALDLSSYQNSFDIVTMLHVGMNIENKSKLFSEVYSALRPGGIFAIYDVMAIDGNTESNDSLSFPLPWASNEDSSFVTSNKKYKDLATETGFVINFEEMKGNFGKTALNLMTTKLKENKLPPLSILVTFGSDNEDKLINLKTMIDDDILAPVHLVFSKKV
jgi:2-polyprenyl-3-methyl-5-hydroxy-6-metoxy-1,4-benzoquinol methylase